MTKLLEQMRANPRGDWRMAELETVCRAFGIACSPSRSGSSHTKISHPSQREILTVPFKRPIKPVYVRKFVQFVDRVREQGHAPP